MKSFMSEIDLIWEGITTSGIIIIVIISNSKSELTWFEKGLRPSGWEATRCACYCEWIDLIWEGITTYLFRPSYHYVNLFWVNWPDLRRDYDIFFSCFPFFRVFREWIDLIWEGITTFVGDIHLVLTCKEWIDLIWEGITTLPSCLRLHRLPRLSELTWFEKGLRRKFLQADIPLSPTPSELTLIWEGITTWWRNFLWPAFPLEWIDLIWEGITTRLVSHMILFHAEWIDLIWEGITTSHLSNPNHFSNIQEWIDLIWEGITTASVRVA